MVRVTDELALSPEHVTLYRTTDPQLGHLPVLIFHGPSTTANYTLNSSRVQVHVYTPAGFQTFPRLTISPNSPFYSVVNHLPREWQGDEVYRGLAFGLFKYFTELPEVVKNHLRNQYPTTRGQRPGSAPSLFAEQHAADLASAMIISENTATIIDALQSALQTQHISNIDLDFVLPPGAIVPLQPEDFEQIPEDEDDLFDPSLRQYGGYSGLVKLFGDPVFLPTSKLRRAPSKPSALNRSKSFSRDQKADLRMKMTELVETEERYVHKLNELVRHIAGEFRQSAMSRSTDSLSPSEEELDKLFPKSADMILQLNSEFYRDLRNILDDTENDAAKDLEIQATITRGGSGKFKDPIGCIAMAKVFLEWFPQFTEAYQEYIRASQHFPKLLNSFLDRQSSFKQRVMNRGEQNVRSTLIEPVQRLPRYSLLIDQIVSCLPITHPALQLMLRARDIITNICSMDDPTPGKPHITSRLRNLIECWPQDLEPQGRLIAAADFMELPPPYAGSLGASVNGSDKTGVFLVFSDIVIMIRKKTTTAMNAKELTREVDKPSAAGLLVSMTNAAGGPASYELAFAGWHNLADIRFTESIDGSRIWMTSTREMKGTQASEYVTSTAVTSRCFALQEGYDGRAMKWSDDIVRARIEGRFGEAEREDPTWTLRTARMPDNNLGLYAAVFQEGADQLVEGRREPAPIRVVVDHEKGTKGAPVGHYGVEIVINIRCGDDLSRIYVESTGLVGKKFTDEVALEDLLPTLSRRVIQLLSMQFNVSNTAIAPALVSYNTKILKGLSFSNRVEKTRSFLTSSPVKMLSSLLAGGGGSNESTYSSPGPKQQRAPIGNVFPPPSLPRSNSEQKETSSIFGSWKSRDGDKGRIGLDEERPENPLVRLEQTFTGYVACLQARKGNIIGRTLLNRSVADELAVNELYNKLIEFPYDIEASADHGSEVIFVSFEKFLRVAWKDQMGPIISMQALDALQQRASRKVPGNFADFVNYLFSDMAPQNRRAFTALIKLLADLLDGCGNDSDRGALTLAFAELLVTDGSAHAYINLLDRLVEDCDRIFEEIGLGSSISIAQTAYEHGTLRAGKSQTASLTSNTSSLRRKFGFDTLLRQGSKHEDRDNRPSMWRSLSKHGRHPATGDSTGYGSLKGSVSRSRSIESHGAGPTKLQRRPNSRDRPPISGAFDDSFQRPASSHRLETIGEPDNEQQQQQQTGGGKGKKKRRSSLSDLKSLMSQVTLEDPPLMPLPLNKRTSEKFNSAPRGPPSPSRIPISPNASQTLRSTNTTRARQKENLQDGFSSPNAASTSTPASDVPRKGSHMKALSSSQIPTLRPGRSGLSGMETPSRLPTSATKAAGGGKLRLQSPQKLRERLQTEKKAADDQDAALKSELSRIAEDMAKVNSGLPRPASMLANSFAASTASQPGSSSPAELRRLAARVSQLEQQLKAQSSEAVLETQARFREEMDEVLKAQEQKVKAIDQLYKEATAENELLYEKFNSELAKILKALRAKKGTEEREELVVKMREQNDAIARVKRENARLKREMDNVLRGNRTMGLTTVVLDEEIEGFGSGCGSWEKRDNGNSTRECGHGLQTTEKASLTREELIRLALDGYR
ncbi:hypothetical protein MKZ38_003172 [Zalerion maritima]|uniref:DH domain-containing protein n=1 Tax=Zalerion maritima TaxID=339359 RepID=A0AAD5S010_9PEZI|nr:hypothetical protein MKZ38_003172 [Zalerion maritima]